LFISHFFEDSGTVWGTSTFSLVRDYSRNRLQCSAEPWLGNTGIQTTLCGVWPGNRRSIPCRDRGRNLFSVPLRPDQPWSTPSVLPTGKRALFTRKKQRTCEIHLSPPPSTEVKNTWSYSSNPSMAWYLIMHKNFICTLRLAACRAMTIYIVV